MTRRSKTAIYHMTEGEVLVRGTDDPTEAIRIIVESNYEENWQWEEVIDALAPGVDLTDEAEEEARKLEAAEFFARRLKPQNHRTGWFRHNIQAPGGDYTWMLGEPKGPGPGNFRGVLFD